MLKGAYRKYWAQGSLLAARAAAAVRRLRDAAIPALAASGLGLLAYYPDRIGCRPTAVAELVVARAAHAAATEALGPDGAGPEPLAIRLRAADDDRFQVALARAVTRPVGQERIAGLPANDLLVEACGDAAARGLSRDLLWAADVMQLVRTPDALDWERLPDGARAAPARAAFEALRGAGVLDLRSPRPAKRGEG